MEIISLQLKYVNAKDTKAIYKKSSSGKNRISLVKYVNLQVNKLFQCKIIGNSCQVYNASLCFANIIHMSR